MIKSKAWILYRFWFFFLFIFSMYPWFTWGIANYVAYSVGVIINIIILTWSYKSFYKAKQSDWAFVLLLLITCLWLHNYSIYSLMSGILLWGTIFPWIMLKDEYKADIIRFITKYFAIILLISITTFILFQIGVDFPHSLIHYRDSYGKIYNYYTFIYLGRGGGPLRFQSIFLEPGHMTMGIAPLLFINRYNLKNKYVLILFIVQLFSFSLAGYIVLALGYLLQWFSSNKRKLYPLLVIPVCITIFIYCQNYVFKDDLVNKFIVERISGEDFNRTSSNLTVEFNKDIQSGQIIVGNQYLPESLAGANGSAGIKVFLYVSGLIGLLLITLVYLYPIIIRQKATKITVSFLIILAALLAQNSYPFWFCIYISLICGSTYLKNEIA